MRIPKAARYALHAVMEMATAGDGLVTASGTARRHTLPPGATAKAFQHLVRGGVALGSRGVGGGYRLAVDPGDLTVLDVISLFDPPGGRGRPSSRRGSREVDAMEERLRVLFAEVDETIRSTLASVTIATLAGAGGETRESA